MFLPLFLLSLSCGSEETNTNDGPPATKRKVGEACNVDTECATSYCLAYEEFSEFYCSAECSAEETCPEEAACEDYRGERWCLARCETDEECREDYVCDYQTCRPRCSANTHCHSPDGCYQGRCKAGCDNHQDCPKEQRCQEKKCVPLCKVDKDCIPGNTCNKTTGLCEPKPGKKMGEACSQHEECATDYCLPTRKICSVQCTGSLDCPSDYVCGLEKIDKEGNGTFEQAEADCVPTKGSRRVGELCLSDDECASSHCYYGFCMEGCKGDADCSNHQCVEVNILLNGGIPKYKGCLPRQGSGTFVLGAWPFDGKAHGFDVPPHASSFILSAEISSKEDVPYIMSLVDPMGNKVTELQDECGFYSQTNRYHYYNEQSNSLFVPNTPAQKLVPGIHEYYLGVTKQGYDITVTLQLKLGHADQGRLNINWIFLNLDNHSCISGGTLNATSAPTHPWFTKIRNSMVGIYQQANITLGTETYQDLKRPELDSIELAETGLSTELQELFSSSAGIKGNAVNVFFVRSIESVHPSGGMYLGISGGIPGPVGRHGLVHSGVVINMESSCYDYSGSNTGGTMAHELGHYLGLFHNQEAETNPGLYDNQIICPCPCGANLGCYTNWDGRTWCRGEDGIQDTSTTHKNLMYYAAEGMHDFEGNQLSAGQIRVMLDNPLVEF